MTVGQDPAGQDHQISMLSGLDLPLWISLKKSMRMQKEAKSGALLTVQAAEMKPIAGRYSWGQELGKIQKHWMANKNIHLS